MNLPPTWQSCLIAHWDYVRFIKNWDYVRFGQKFRQVHPDTISVFRVTHKNIGNICEVHGYGLENLIAPQKQYCYISCQ